MSNWSKERIKGASFAPREATYEVIPASSREELFKVTHPHLFKLKALSIGDEHGQLCIIPLDESSRETGEFILRAIAAYQGE